MQAKSFMSLGRSALRMRNSKRKWNAPRSSLEYPRTCEKIYYHICSYQSTSASNPEIDSESGQKIKVRLHTTDTLKPTTAKKVSHIRAIQNFCLENHHLEGLPFEKRQGENGGPDVRYYLESTLLEKAIEVHGSKRNLEKIRKTDNWKREDVPNRRNQREQEEQAVHMKRSLKVVGVAFTANLTDSFSKFIGWQLTGSHSLFAECIHSIADTCNQLIVGAGIFLSSGKPNKMHPYGYSNMRNITSLISGVGILFIGTGVNVYRGVNALVVGAPLEPLTWAAGLLAVSFFTQGITIYRAWKEVRRRSQEANIRSWEFIRRNHDPGLNVVLMEDSASVVGVVVAGSCILLSHLIASPIPDAVGSILIGGLLASIAVPIVHLNVSQLIGKSIPELDRQKMIEHLKKDEMILSLSDVKVTEMGSNEARFKAEIEIDGRAVARASLLSRDMSELLTTVKSFQTEKELQDFMEDHGDKVLKELGKEIDRIENVFKTEYPQLRHVDLEPL